MCGCQVKVSQSEFERLILDRKKREQMTEKVTISKKAFIDGSLHEFLKFTWAIDKDALINAFKEKGIAIKDFKDLKMLAVLAEKGLDRSGSLIANGKKFSFSVMDILREINVSNDKLNDANINWID
jgi:hypothetical protein